MNPTLSCLLADLPPSLADALTVEFDRLTAERDEARRALAALAEDMAMLRMLLAVKEGEVQGVRAVMACEMAARVELVHRRASMRSVN